MSLKNMTLPEFNHPEVRIFYEQDLSMSKAQLEQILQLPRTTLVADMETIILDWLQRTEYFKANESDGSWFSIHFHALWVLVELKAVEALPTILKILEQDDDFNWYWFSDYTTEDLWEIYYYLGQHQLELLKTALLAPGIWVFRTIPSTVAGQICLHQPERQQEILDWYSSVLDAFLAMEEGDPALDPETISFVIWDLMPLQPKALMPRIKALYDRDLVLDDMFGDFQSLKQRIEMRDHKYRKRDIMNSIFDRYEDAMKWHGYQMEYNEDYRKKNTYKPSPSSAPFPPPPPKKQSTSSFSYTGTVKRKGKKVGRNDLCPCGSGKKYKKCCLRK